MCPMMYVRKSEGKDVSEVVIALYIETVFASSLTVTCISEFTWRGPAVSQVSKRFFVG